MIKCEICGREFKSILSLSHHVVQGEKIEKNNYYDKYLLKDGEKTCYCGNATKFISLGKGYHKFCSTKCSANNIETRNKFKNTCNETYGESNPNKCIEIKEKRKTTVFKKYGVTHYSKTDEFKEQYKNTNLKLYGVKNYSQTDEFKVKYEDAMMKNHGVKHNSQIKSYREKVKTTCLEKYGVDSYSKTDECKEKRKQTCLKKYGYNNPSQVPEIKIQKKEKFLNNYGVNSPFESIVILKKAKNTAKKNFYNKLFNIRVKNKVTPLFTLDEYIDKETKYLWKCNTCLTEFKDHIDDGRIPRCQICYPILTGFSKGEKEISSFCKIYYPNLIENDRTVLNGKELDIYIPEINLAIEFNGLYWHSELNGKNESYHLNKYLKCKEKGIKLIQIFEDEWFDKHEIIKSILLNKMNKIYNKIYARKCVVKEIDNNISSEFLNDNHIQGNINSKYNIGLYHKNELVSLLILGNSKFNKEYEYEIHRFCNKINYNIPGSLSKLFKYFTDKYLPKSVITYSDLRYGEGNSYTNLGFKFKNISNPNYYYLDKDLKKYSRQKFQKHKLSNILESYDESLTEWQNMQLNGYDRIWDCGNNVFEWSN